MVPTLPAAEELTSEAKMVLWSIQIREGMRLLFRSAKLAVEPAGAAALAALMHPLRERLDGKSVGVVVCGANIDPETFAKQITQAPTSGTRE